MSPKFSSNTLDNCEDALSLLDEFIEDDTISDVLSFAGDEIPGLRLLYKSYNSISDRFFRRKLEKFIKYANEGSSDYSFEKFKEDIRDNKKYREEVTEYLSFKIDKFDTDFKLKILSKSSLDFFNGNIDFNSFVDLSECLDLISRKDILIMEYLSKRGDFKFTPTVLYVKGLTLYDINSSIRKLHMLSLIEEDDDIFYEEVSSDPSYSTHSDSKLTKSYYISELGNLLIKYLD
ncbi:hypothetical protein [Romboutsia hominis]|uniref:Uncharacterized protein n=1 Tax=Romboutsia hominis TaxID=1507512 RepID=A0A2P2BRB1_9FIRM|nr:hypothetical protein [Romboutsia hominis]CEI72918.1 Hypothetical protein FRIFI_1383 [Romboutsia hominis]